MALSHSVKKPQASVSSPVVSNAQGGSEALARQRCLEPIQTTDLINAEMFHCFFQQPFFCIPGSLLDAGETKDEIPTLGSPQP